MHKRFMIHEGQYNIPCLLYSDGGSAFDRIIICCHGFAGHKGNAAMKRFADYVLSRHKNLAVLCFDWPCHGKDDRKKLRLEDCITYLDLVIRYAETELAAKDLYLYATSFGGYLALLYIAERGNPFQKLALRCPAVNMYEVLASGIMTEEDKIQLSKGKSVLIGFDTQTSHNPTAQKTRCIKGYVGNDSITPQTTGSETPQEAWKERFSSALQSVHRWHEKAPEYCPASPQGSTAWSGRR